ncbi:MAG: amidohydrolase [Bacteroidetes bacterium]|nr:amidohydrolase [Bacteroidota bacterium]
MHDILFENGNFWTGNRQFPHAGHLICSAGRISSVGKDKSPHAGAITKVDLKGHFAMPGFIDAHTHFRFGGASLKRLDLRKAADEDDFSEAVRGRSRSQPSGKWLLGVNWNHENWRSRRLPSKALIDDFTSSFPVFLDRIDTHLALVNSRTLELAGIKRDTPDPPGGIIGRDDHGEPTGILKDTAREMVLRLIPQPPLEELMLDAREAMRLANSFGVTSVNDIGPEHDLNAYAELERRSELTVRINMFLPISEYGSLVDRGIKADTRIGNSEWLKLGAVKAFADGSLGAGTAWFFDPYDDDRTNSGLATEILASGELERYALEADRNHIQLAIHAIGDKAVSSVLDVYEKVASVNPSWDRRFRIEHAQHLREEDFARFRKLSVIASVQPYHCADDGSWAGRKIGRRRERDSFAFRRFLDNGTMLAFGTDWPVAPLDPLQGIHAAVTRATTDGMIPGGWVPEQKITIEEALRAYTHGSAYASFFEMERGTLETGKLADIAVLSRNPFEVPPEELGSIKVVMTVVGSTIVYADARFFDTEHDEFAAS